MAEPIEVSFRLSTRVGPGNHVLDRGPDPTWEGEILRGHPIVKYRDTLRLSVQKRQTNRDAIWALGSNWPKESC